MLFRSLSAARYQLAATGSSSAGYFGGGLPGPRSTMDKVTYSSDTTAAVPGAALSAARYSLAASSARANALPQPPVVTGTPATVSNDTPNTGYFGGGFPGPRSTMDKITYSTDTTAAVTSANLSAARNYLAASSSSIAGYFGGGGSGSALGTLSRTTMEKLIYSTDTITTVPGASLTAARYSIAATGNSTAGYFGSTPASFSTMDKLTYSTDTTVAVPAARLSAARGYLSATGSSTAGYFGGGAPAYSTMDKVSYITDTTAAVPGANLSAARGYLAATGSSTAGYFGGGFSTGPSFYSTMDKVT